MTANEQQYGVSATDVATRALKYIFEGIVVAIAAFTLPTQTLEWSTIYQIGLIATSTFAILDFFSPTMSKAARMGAGAGMGANLVGFPGRMPPPTSR